VVDPTLPQPRESGVIDADMVVTFIMLLLETGLRLPDASTFNVVERINRETQEVACNPDNPCRGLLSIPNSPRRVGQGPRPKLCGMEPSAVVQVPLNRTSTRGKFPFPFGRKAAPSPARERIDLEKTHVAYGRIKQRGKRMPTWKGEDAPASAVRGITFPIARRAAIRCFSLLPSPRMDGDGSPRGGPGGRPWVARAARRPGTRDAHPG
jgi:hypothetical protein